MHVSINEPTDTLFRRSLASVDRLDKVWMTEIWGSFCKEASYPCKCVRNRFSLHCLFEHGVACWHFVLCSVFIVCICHQSSFPL